MTRCRLKHKDLAHSAKSALQSNYAPAVDDPLMKVIFFSGETSNVDGYICKSNAIVTMLASIKNKSNNIKL